MGLALSRANPPLACAHWIEGFLAGSAAELVHDAPLLGALDEWIQGLRDDHFIETLPGLRRTFSKFPIGERRQIAAALRRGTTAAAPAAAAGVSVERARRVLPVLQRILSTEAR